MTDTRLSQNSPVSVTIGATTYTGVVLVAGPQIQAVGGGAIVRARSVANNTEPIGPTFYPVEAITIVTLDADIMPALLSAGYIDMDGEPTNLSAFVITEKNTSGQTRTVTFTAAKTYIQNPSPRNTNLGDQVIELTILSYGAITYSSWA